RCEIPKFSWYTRTGGPNRCIHNPKPAAPPYMRGYQTNLIPFPDTSPKTNMNPRNTRRVDPEMELRHRLATFPAVLASHSTIGATGAVYPMKVRTVAVLLGLAAMSLPVYAAGDAVPPRPKAGKVEIMPLKDVKPGMKGTAWTVLQ